MIQEVRIETVEDLMPLLAEQEYRPELGRNRNGYIYRGMPDTSYKMATSLSRCCKHLQKTLEPAILNNFAKYALREDPTVTQSVWNRMMNTRPLPVKERELCVSSNRLWIMMKS